MALPALADIVIKAMPLLLLCLLAWGAGADESASERLTPLRLQLSWWPQAQFAGYYVALSEGYYRDAGIDLRLLGGGGHATPREALRAGTTDLAILWLPEAIRARAQGLPLVNVAQLFQHSSILLVARAEAGIRTPADLDGKRLGLVRDNSRLPVEVLLARHGLRVKRIEQSSSQTASVEPFLRGLVDVQALLDFNGYFQLLNAGLEPEDLVELPLAALDVDFPEDGLYALAPTVAHDPALMHAFIAATRHGWARALADPEASVDLVLSHQRAAHVPANRLHQTRMLERLRDRLIEDWGADPAAWDWQLRAADVVRVGTALMEAGLLESMPDDLNAFGAR